MVCADQEVQTKVVLRGRRAGRKNRVHGRYKHKQRGRLGQQIADQKRRK